MHCSTLERAAFYISSDAHRTSACGGTQHHRGLALDITAERLTTVNHHHDGHKADDHHVRLTEMPRRTMVKPEEETVSAVVSLDGQDVVVQGERMAARKRKQRAPKGGGAVQVDDEAHANQMGKATSPIRDQQQTDGPAASPKKRGKRVEKDDKEETRGARLRRGPSQQVQQRLQRVQLQTMFLVHRDQETSVNAGPSSSSAAPIRETFKVLGSTGNVYSVVISKQPNCDCPDAIKNDSGICKHIIFVFLRVLGVPSSSHVWYQKALLSSELDVVFRNARPDPTVSNPSLKQAYLDATSSIASKVDAAEGKKRRIPQEGDICPVCYEQFDQGQTDDLTFCEESCGNPLHKVCAAEWARSCPRLGQAVTCIYCRVPVGRKAGLSACHEDGSYLNLADGSGVVQLERDFSIYGRQSKFSLTCSTKSNRSCYAL